MDAAPAFQSTLPARGATPLFLFVRVTEVISIHAPRTGSDFCTMPVRFAICYFNPRSPHGERPKQLLTLGQKALFQSTLPARGATFNFYGQQSYEYISIHAPRTGSDHSGRPVGKLGEISIHAPRTGSDEMVRMLTGGTSMISIHAPRTGSDQMDSAERADYRISIHAPRTGSDKLLRHRSAQGDISIHAPRTGSDCAK